MTRPVRLLRWRPVGVLSLLCVLACGSCGTGVVASQDAVSGLTVAPRMTSLPPGGTGTFVAVAQGAFATGTQALSAGVAWTASAGSITSAGLYTAPTQLGSYQIQATYAGKTGLATANVVPQGTPGALYATASSTCAAMPIRATGVTHYFCDCATGAQAGCVAGSDTNDGLTTSTPKQSLSALVTIFNAMNGGDTIALCQGGAWSTSTTVAFSTTNANCSGTANNRNPAVTTTCDLRDYAPSWGGTARPIIRETGAVDLLQFWLSKTKGVRILNLDLEGAGGGVSQRGIALGNNSGGNNDNFLICNNVINGWTYGIHLNGSSGVGDDIWGNRITSISDEGILGSSSGGKIDSNYFQDAGAVTAGTHSIYLDPHTVTETNFSLINNEFRFTRACGGAIVVLHGWHDGTNIENNIIDGGASAGGSCYGLSINDGGYPVGCFFRNLTVRRNLVENVGFRSIDVSEAPGAVIENNIVVQSQTGYGIAAPGSAHRTSPLDDTMTAAVIRNNTLYFASGAPNSYGIYNVASEGTNYVFANNAMQFAGTGGSCLNFGMPVASYAYVDHHLCNGFRNWEATRGTLAAWQTYSGGRFDAASLTSAPQFENAPTTFRPAVGSLLIGNGDAAQAPAYDFTLSPRPTPPSIGALER